MAFTISGLLGYPAGSLQPGNTVYDANVYALQEWLVKNGFLTQTQVNTGPGIYGGQTTAAVKTLQAQLGVNAGLYPGYYGPATIAAIQAELAVLETPTVTNQTLGQTWTIGQSVSFTLASNTFTDPQNESLSYSAALAGGGALPSWLGFNVGNLTFYGTVPSSATSLNILVTATDSGGRSTSETFTVTVPQAAYSDLLPEYLSLGASSVSVGGALGVSWTMLNRGPGAASASTTGIRITSSSSDHGGPSNDIAEVVTSALASGASVAQSYTVSVPQTEAPGTYYVWVVADNSNPGTANQGGNTGNDFQLVGSFTVTAPTAEYDASIVPGGKISQHFGAVSPWDSIALNTSDIPAGDMTKPITHPAVDILAPLGTEVDAFAGGTVIKMSTGASDLFWNSLGWYVLVSDSGSAAPDVAGGKSFYTLYVHLSNQPLVSLNQTINVGSKIGTVGTTGNETGVPAGDGLLHFEIRLFPDLFQPYPQWNLPKISGSKSNIYIYGDQSAASLLADPSNTGLGYINPEPFLNSSSSSDARPTAIGHDQTAAPGTVIPLTTLFTYSDADGLSDIVGFSVQDHTNGGGYLTLNGNKESDNIIYGDSTYGIPISQIGQWAYVVGAAGSNDSVAFNAIDSHGEFNSAAYATVVGQSGGGGSSPVTSYDFSGDNKSDILWRDTTGAVALWNSTSTGNYGYGVLGTVDSTWQIAGVGDFNYDGLADVLWRNTNGAVALWDANGSGGVTGVSLGTVDNGWQIAGVGDFNGDHKADILWRNASGVVEIWESTSSGGYSLATPGSADNSWQIAGVGDFNGDNESDVLWRNSNGDTYLWTSNGAGGFTAVGVDLGVVQTNWQIAGVGDFNGDHKADILWRNNSSGEVAQWDSTASSAYAFVSLGTVDSSWQIAGVGDFNGDHLADILWHNSSGAVALWDANGSGGVTGVSLGTVAPAWQIQAA